MYLKLLYDMHHTLFRFTPNIRNDIYLKDPTSSLLGNNLIRHSIDLIDEVGLEEFNFKSYIMVLELDRVSTDDAQYKH